jgi:hypothetical protein
MGIIESARVAASRYLADTDRAKRLLAGLRPSSLDWLATVYGTDKGRHHWKRGGHGYMGHYRTHLAPFDRRQPLTLLEIGIASGASLLLWRSYFPHGLIAGIDIDPSPVSGDRLRTFQGDQQDAAFLAHVLNEVGTPNIVIDDGSHVGTHLNASFAALWPHLAPGGLYVIEDTQTADDQAFGDGPDTSTTLAQSLVSKIRVEVEQLHIYPEITFVAKSSAASPCPSEK